MQDEISPPKDADNALDAGTNYGDEDADDNDDGDVFDFSADGVVSSRSTAKRKAEEINAERGERQQRTGVEISTEELTEAIHETLVVLTAEANDREYTALLLLERLKLTFSKCRTLTYETLDQVSANALSIWRQAQNRHAEVTSGAIVARPLVLR